jgi:hypothetical protein
MLGARAAGLGGTLPPKAITDAMLESIGADPRPETRVALAAAQHVGFGVATGALFGTIAPRSRVKSIAAAPVMVSRCGSPRTRAGCPRSVRCRARAATAGIARRC